MRRLLDLLATVPGADAAVSSVMARPVPHMVDLALRGRHGGAVLRALIDLDAFDALTPVAQARIVGGVTDLMPADGPSPLQDLLNAGQVPPDLFARLYETRRSWIAPSFDRYVRLGVVQPLHPMLTYWMEELRTLEDALADGAPDVAARAAHSVSKGAARALLTSLHPLPPDVLRRILRLCQGPGEAVRVLDDLCRQRGEFVLDAATALDLLHPDRFAAWEQAKQQWEAQYDYSDVDRAAFAKKRALEVRDVRVAVARQTQPAPHTPLPAPVDAVMRGYASTLSLEQIGTLFGHDPAALLELVQGPVGSETRASGGRPTFEDWIEFLYALAPAARQAIADTAIPIIARLARARRHLAGFRIEDDPTGVGPRLNAAIAAARAAWLAEKEAQASRITRVRSAVDRAAQREGRNRRARQDAEGPGNDASMPQPRGPRPR